MDFETDLVLMEANLKTKKKARAELKPCPELGCVQAVEFQLFDNGEAPGKGNVRHKLKVEAYCEDKLVIGKPYWSRVCDLLDVKTFMRWVEREKVEGRISDEQYAIYDAGRILCDEWEADEAVCEFAKMGHVEVDGNQRVIGQFVIVRKELGKGLRAMFVVEGDFIEHEQFWYNPGWRRNPKSRKFMGRWDPHNMFGKARPLPEPRAPEPSRPPLLSPQELALMRARGVQP